MKYLSVLIILLFVSCEYLESYPVEPQVSFNGYSVSFVLPNGNKGSRVGFRFRLTDGDGDIGLTEEEKEAIRKEAEEKGEDPEIPLTLFVTQYNVVNGNFELQDSKTPLGATADYLQPQGQNKTLIADVEYYKDLLTNEYLDIDSVKFEFYMVDRAGNQSNIGETKIIPIKEETNGFVK